MQRSTANPAVETGRAGFTLIEVLLAGVVFLIGMLTLTAMQLHSLQGASSGRHASQAAAIAESQMEQLQRLAWANVTTTTGWSTATTVNNTVQASPNQVEQAYTLDWRVTDLVTGWTRSVDVRVRWNEPKRANRSVVLSSIRYNREGN